MDFLKNQKQKQKVRDLDKFEIMEMFAFPIAPEVILGEEDLYNNKS